MPSPNSKRETPTHPNTHTLFPMLYCTSTGDNHLPLSGIVQALVGGCVGMSRRIECVCVCDFMEVRYCPHKVVSSPIIYCKIHIKSTSMLLAFVSMVCVCMI